VRDAIPKPRDVATAEFATIRLRLLKIAARVIETAGRVHLQLVLQLVRRLICFAASPTH
jgi:hypothetical protein